MRTALACADLVLRVTGRLLQYVFSTPRTDGRACDQAMIQAVLSGRNKRQLNAIGHAMTISFQNPYCTGGRNTVNGIRFCPGNVVKR